MPVGNHLLKLGRVFESVLEIIHERRRQDPPDQSEIHGDPHEDHAMRVTVSPSLDVIEGLPNGLEFQSPDPAYPTTLPSSSFNPDALSPAKARTTPCSAWIAEPRLGAGIGGVISA
ncbi:hypothetical protein KXW94_009224 [Aspergillus fumigatus]|nr:hypothetical protein KXW94_009224 [Aspergillus fumigatus]